jgi:hypothetical protein
MGRSHLKYGLRRYDSFSDEGMSTLSLVLVEHELNDTGNSTDGKN